MKGWKHKENLKPEGKESLWFLDNMLARFIRIPFLTLLFQLGFHDYFRRNNKDRLGSMFHEELQTELLGSKQSRSKMFSWAKFSWKASDQSICAVCIWEACVMARGQRSRHLLYSFIPHLCFGDDHRFCEVFLGINPSFFLLWCKFWIGKRSK